MTVRTLNLVAPLAHKATAMHTAETAGKHAGRSGAVSPMIGHGHLRGDVDSANKRPSSRISPMATRTGTTSTTTTECAPSANSSNSYSFDLLLQAYLDCRDNKRNSPSALLFEQHLERNLYQLHRELLNGSYKPGKSTCFVVTHPSPREVWAADFRDRIVHHLIYNHAAPYFLARFIPDSCACIKGRGTHYAPMRLESKVRSITQNWTKPAYYLKCDIANFFVSIDKNILWPMIEPGMGSDWWRNLAYIVTWHDPTKNYEYRGDPKLLNLVPPHKRLTNQPEGRGLAIGNHSSQFDANILLNLLDQFAKHRIGARYYVRYVDDFVILHESAEWLNDALAQINEFLPIRLGLRLNPRKTILQPIDRGIDFVGQVIKPHRRETRRKTVRVAIARCGTVADDDLLPTANSYLGQLRQTKSHGDRAHVCKALMKRGYSVEMNLTKTYRRNNRGITQ